MRLAIYAWSSADLAAAVIVKALHERANFYSATVYLAQSNACVMILSNVLLFNVGMMVFGLQRLLYGPLRPIEVEQLYEKGWFAITETCLAMTIFRSDLGVWFYILFVSLLIGKVWGWIGEGRVEILDQQPLANPRLFHARLAASLALSILFDLWFLDYTVDTIRVQNRLDMVVMFAFEFAVLSVTSVSTCIRYCISLREIAITQKQVQARVQERREQIVRERERRAQEDGEARPPVDEEIDEDEIDVPGWEEKGRWIFYLDLATDFIKLVLYLTFFCVLCISHGMPIHIIRDVAITIRSFYKRIADFVKYRQATQDMHERYPDATAQEIGIDNVCIICREPMRLWQPEAGEDAATSTGRDERLRPKKLPCGHILHFSCLRSWLERQQNCPTCRQPVLVNQSPRAGGQGNAGGQPLGNAGGAQGGQQRPGPGQNRIRFFNLGPLRLGFGAGPDVQRLAQQMQNPQPPPPQVPQGMQPQVGSGQPQAGRMRLDVRASPASTSLQLRAQIEQIERQLLQEVNNLRVQSQELSTVRALLNELTRLRALNQGATSQQAQVPVQNQTGPIGLPPLPRQTAAPVHVFGAQNEQVPQQNLPEGLTIPPGWSLIPLQRMNGAQAPGAMAQPDSRPGPPPAAGNTDMGAEGANQPEQSQLQTHAQPPPSVGPAYTAGRLSPGVSEGTTSTHPADASTRADTSASARETPPVDASGSEHRPESERKVETTLHQETHADSSSSGRDNGSQASDGVTLPNWRPRATTVEDAEDSS